MTFKRWSFWAHLLIFVSISSQWSFGTGSSINCDARVAKDDKVNGICQRKYIRDPIELNTIRGCRVIEGSLQISLLQANSTDVYKNYTFPDLREITGYLLVFYSSNLTTLRYMFPNLAVIRGQELVETHSLIVQKMPDLQEVGLSSLTDVLKGTVWIVDNAKLCYVDTIDWKSISKEFTSDKIYKNKRQCPNTCHSSCPYSDFDSRSLCWSNDNCQTVPRNCSDCRGKLCAPNGKCCHSECLGGCTGTAPDQCKVCKHVVVANRCTDLCPDGYYEYLQRRCVQDQECLQIVASPEQGKAQTGKLYVDHNGKKHCVLKCPINSELASNGTACIPCDGICKKNCPGRTVDTIEVAREFAGCTRITGALKISIRRGSTSAVGTIVKELKHNFAKIEEIDHYLAITYTYSIHSLDFLENLKIIRGIRLEEDKYALMVKSNENLMELWDFNETSNDIVSSKRKIIIENKKARVLFHYNPKLCPNIIWEFVTQAGILRPKDDKIDIGITNGDKVPCNTKRLVIQITQKTNSTVTVKWENFRRNLTLTSHLLNYEIHYKEAIGYPNKTVSKFEDRDPCGDDGWNIYEQAKISDNDVVGTIEKEPDWENEGLIVNLKPFTFYALYVKAIVIPDENSLNNNTGAESDIIYFRTWAHVPSKPRGMKLGVGGPNTLTVTWEPPAHPNGIMHSFKIWYRSVPEQQAVQDQRDFCKSGRSESIYGFSMKNFKDVISPSKPPTTESPLSPDPNCSCSANYGSGEKKDNRNLEDKIGEIYDENSVFDAILKHVLYVESGGKNDDSSCNEVRKSSPQRRRRRSPIGENKTSSSQETFNDNDTTIPIVFPGFQIGTSSFPMDTDVDLIEPTKDMRLYETIIFNSSILSYTLALEGLVHYTAYEVGIQACRQQDDEIKDNDTRICSDLVSDRVQTAPSKIADRIDLKSIFINITDGNRLQLRWVEPPSPNGVIMAYQIKVQRVGSTKDEPPQFACITHKNFLDKGKNYTFANTFHPGNYSVKIQVNSLALDSEFTIDKYFYIEDLNGHSSGFWALVIILPILVSISITSCFMYYYAKSKGIVDGPRVTSVNPEYMKNVDIPDHWEVSRDKIEIGRELGGGSFGKVYEGILHDFIIGNQKMRCAIKTVTDDAIGEDRALFLREAALMTQLSCQHVVKLLGVISKTQPIYVIMELMGNGDLKTFLRSRRPPDPSDEDKTQNNDPPPTLRQILRIASEISDGMTYIHSHRLVHRDLAARNCMVDDNLCVKVGDFGMTKEVIQTDYYRKQTKGLLPVRWMAPESLHDGVFTGMSDMWSFGVVIWEMATLAAQPYQGLANRQVLDFVQSGRTMDRPENCPDILYDLMCRCWQYNPRHRPTFIDILDKLTPDLEPSFAPVSFYFSSEGQEYKNELLLRSNQEELITIRTPLRATFEDDELDDYDSDDDHHLNHHIIDDLGDTPSRRLMRMGGNQGQSSKYPSVIPSNQKPLINGLALTPLTISGTVNNSSSTELRNGNSVLYPSIPPVSNQNQKPSLFSNPPLLSSYSLMPNNNYTTGSFNNKPNQNTQPVTSSKVNELIKPTPDSVEPSTSRNGMTGTTYTSIIPSQSSGQIHNNSSSVNLANNLSSGGGGSGLESNESSKSCSVTFSSGERNKVGNGGGGGGNGYITLRHPAGVNENQKNRTTQF